MKLNIRQKLSIPIIAVFSAITLIVTLFFPYQIKRQITGAMEDKLGNMGRILGAALEEGVTKAKFGQVQKITAKVSQTHGLSHLLILDETGTLLHSHPSDQRVAPSLSRRLGSEQFYEESGALNRIVFLKDEDRKIGYLVIGLSLAERDRQIRNTKWTIVIGSVSIMACCLFILMVVSGRIVEPIHLLKVISGRVSEGDRTASMNRELETGDEVEDLAKAYFKMLEGLRSNEQSLAEAMGHLKEANDELKNLDEMKSSFLNTVSHELRTPLTAIKANVEIMLMKPNLAEERRIKFLKVMNSEADRLTRLINDVLDLAKIEAGKAVWRVEENKVDDLLDHCHIVVEPSARKKNIRLETDIAPGLPVLPFDRDRIEQVVINLMNNAVKFTPENGVITMRAALARSENQNYVRVSVQDNGKGIPKDKQGELFSKFKQVGDTLTSKPEGTGLGLAISREIILHHKGRIWLESEEGKGSTFFFTLPVGGPVVHTEPEFKAPNREAQSSPPPPAHSNSKTILIVEDDPSIRETLLSQLTEEGYSCLTAASGGQAVELARTKRPDLITLDVFLPDVSGLDVARVLRHDDITKSIPIVMVTIMEDRQEGMKAGADAFVVKPFRQAQLLHEVSRFVGHPGKKSRVLVADDSAEIREAVREILEDAGLEVLLAADGQEALDICRAEFPDLVLLDVKMPKMTGDEVLRELKRNTETATIPVLILTGYASGEGRSAALEMGAVNYLSKGESLRGVLDEIRKTLT